MFNLSETLSSLKDRGRENIRAKTLFLDVSGTERRFFFQCLNPTLASWCPEIVEHRSLSVGTIRPAPTFGEQWVACWCCSGQVADGSNRNPG